MSTNVRPSVKSSLLADRLSRLAPLDEPALVSLQSAEQNTRSLRARFELTREGEPIRRPLALLSGWACRQRILANGQRQVLTFLLPGDLIGVCHHTGATSAASVLTVTDAVTCPFPDTKPGSALAEAVARSAALEEHYLMAQITRIGRLNAYQRIADWLLETCDRLAFAGLATRSEFKLPVTQELLADTLGLTSVHVNRTLQALRGDGLLIARAGVFAFPDRARVESLVDYKSASVST